MGTATNTIVWAVLCVSQLIYVFVAFQKPPSGSTPDAAQAMFPPLLVVALLLAAGTLWIRRSMLIRPIQSRAIDFDSGENVGKSFVSFILSRVLTQSISIYGLVLTFLSDDERYVIGFVAASLLLMWIHRPFAAEMQNPPAQAEIAKRPPPIS